MIGKKLVGRSRGILLTSFGIRHTDATTRVRLCWIVLVAVACDDVTGLVGAVDGTIVGRVEGG